MLQGLLLVVALALASGPGAPPAPIWGDVLPRAEVTELSEAGRTMLRAHVEGGVDAELRWSDFGDLRPELARFYEARGWTLAWTSRGRPTDPAWQVAALLMDAERKGLDPLDYGGDWDRRLTQGAKGDGGEAEQVRLDVALTVSALRYAGDLAFGRIRPVPGTELLGRIQLERRAGPRPDLAARVALAATAADPEPALTSVEPAWPVYRRTLAALADRRARAAAPQPEPLPSPPDGAAAPEHYPWAERLAERLRAEGERVDGAGESGADAAEACTSPLSEALARFQEHRGLDATGFVDEATLRELNAPPSKRIAQLTRSLERWRWFPRSLPAEPLLVNVPEFKLHAGNGRPITMRVVVGQAYEWGTPVFASELTSVIFRPPWSVPLGIQQAELVPRVEADRGWIAAGDFDVVDSTGKGVPPVATPELLSGLRSGALQLRQRPGPGNALGLVKFDLSHSAWIYLHGTPAQELFARTRRDFSHGCIRVEDPAALVAWVLRDEPGWTPGAVRAAMAGPATLEVPVRKPIPVQIGYFTAIVGEDGVPRFFEDVYGQDAALGQALADEARRRGGGG